jgi:hypothetical protein
METVTGLFNFALLAAITLGTFIVLQFFKTAGKILSEIWKKVITFIVGIVLCFVWYYLKLNQNIDILILTFFGAVGFYDIIIKTITKKIGGSDDSENNTSTR